MADNAGLSAKVAAIAATHANLAPEEKAVAVARQRADRIRKGLDAVAQLADNIAAAYQARDWEVLGYDSWQKYVDGEFVSARLRLPRDDRRGLVALLHAHGLSTRAIAAATGASKNTITDDLRHVSQSGTAEAGAVVGLDGKVYSPRQQEPDVVDAEIVEDNGGDFAAQATATAVAFLGPEGQLDDVTAFVESVMADPVVADQITNRIAKDKERVTEVLRKRNDQPRVARPREKRETDYDELMGRAVNWISVALAAKQRGAWEPTGRTKALLHFARQLLLDEELDCPIGMESVGDSLAREAEAFLNDRGGAR